jgi:hypothetical protein
MDILGGFHPPEKALSDTILGIKYALKPVPKGDDSERYRWLRASLPGLLLTGLILQKQLAQEHLFTLTCPHNMYQFLC